MSLYTRDKRQTELNTSYKLVLKINDDGILQKKKNKKGEEEREKKKEEKRKCST
jgi:hypothetical protein